MTMRNSARLLAVALLIGVAAAGCSSSSKKASPTTTTTTKAANKTFQVHTSEGQVSFSLDGKLPPNWPSEFPVAPTAKAAGSGSLGGTDKTVLVGVYSSTGPPEDAFNFYKSTTAYTVDTSSSVGAGTAYVGNIKFSGSYQGTATIVGLSGTTYIVVVLHTGGTDTSTTTTSDGSSTTTTPTTTADSTTTTTTT